MQNQNFGWRVAGFIIGFLAVTTIVVSAYYQWCLKPIKTTPQNAQVVDTARPHTDPSKVPDKNLRIRQVDINPYPAVLQWLGEEKERTIKIRSEFLTGRAETLVVRHNPSVNGYPPTITVHKKTEGWHLYWTIPENESVIMVDPSHEGSPSRSQLLREHLLMEDFFRKVFLSVNN
jgi:hypothetical protein